MCATDDLIMVDLVEMETRCRAATSGPWDSYVVGRDSEAGLNCIGTGDARLLEIVGGTIADQDFIASAREDVPMLIAEIRRLSTMLKALQHAASEHLLVSQSNEISQSPNPAQ